MFERVDRTEVIISLGSNVDREHYLPEAIRLLRRHRSIDVTAASRFYESPSVGGPDAAPDFFNAAVLAQTTLSALQLRQVLRHIEEVLGRVRSDDVNAPRTIDLDVVYYGDQVDEGEEFQLPDPGALIAPHVAVPVAEVAPEWKHPVSGETTHDIVAKLDTTAVRPVSDVYLDRSLRVSSHVRQGDRREVYAPRLEGLVRDQLIEIGEDPKREGLLRTPLRVAKAMDFLTSGYAMSLEEVVDGALFDAEGADEIVVVKDIEFYSMCEHHMLPFFGKAAVAYLPDKTIIGLSKVARIVDLYARRLQVQERLTNQVAAAARQVLSPHGVAVVLDGRHLCMMMRGVQKQESSTVTSAMLGTFKKDARTRAELMALLHR